MKHGFHTAVFLLIILFVGFAAWNNHYDRINAREYALDRPLELHP